jgi:hypothetical protein
VVYPATKKRWTGLFAVSLVIWPSPVREPRAGEGGEGCCPESRSRAKRRDARHRGRQERKRSFGERVNIKAKYCVANGWQAARCVGGTTAGFWKAMWHWVGNLRAKLRTPSVATHIMLITFKTFMIVSIFPVSTVVSRASWLETPFLASVAAPPKVTSLLAIVQELYDPTTWSLGLLGALGEVCWSNGGVGGRWFEFGECERECGQQGESMPAFREYKCEARASR